MLLRGDKAKEDSRFTPTPGGHAHTTDLIRQVVRFNEGFFADGTPIKHPGAKFDFGVACYPEKHEEAPNLERDMEYLKQKQDLGAQYAVTQLFFDNSKFFDFVEKARQMGITIPIIPGIKPMAKLSQLTVVPKTFHCDIPEALAKEIVKCKTDEQAGNWVSNGPPSSARSSMSMVSRTSISIPCLPSTPSWRSPNDYYSHYSYYH